MNVVFYVIFPDFLELMKLEKYIFIVLPSQKMLFDLNNFLLICSVSLEGVIAILVAKGDDDHNFDAVLVNDKVAGTSESCCFYLSLK